VKHSPWGFVNKTRKIERGLSWIEGKNGSGFMASKGYAKRYLSQPAREAGVPWGNYFYYDTKNTANIIFMENEKAKKVFVQNNPEIFDTPTVSTTPAANRTVDVIESLIKSLVETLHPEYHIKQELARQEELMRMRAKFNLSAPAPIPAYRGVGRPRKTVIAPVVSYKKTRGRPKKPTSGNNSHVN